MIVIIISILKGIENMKQVSLSLLLLSALTINAIAGKETVVDGYIRGTYQSHDVKDDRVYKDDAIGGKLHFETASTDGVSLGASYYGTTEVFNDDNKGLIPLRGESHKSYAILGELYLKYESENSMLKVGRQEIDTPFAQTDDIGMIPNSFESVMFETQSFKDTTLVVGEIQKMAGVDAPRVDKFTKVNGSDNMQVLGVHYEGIEKTTLDGWYYHLNNAEVNSIAFLEVDYEKEFGSISYGVGIQYTHQRYEVGKTANIYGGTLSATVKKLGVTATVAHTKVYGNRAFSGFGGGPFYSNSEYLILDNAGEEGRATWFGLTYEATNRGLKGLLLGLGQITLKNNTNQEARETDFTAHYSLSKNSEMHLIASNLKGIKVGEDDAKHLRVFVNYNF